MAGVRGECDRGGTGGSPKGKGMFFFVLMELRCLLNVFLLASPKLWYTVDMQERAREGTNASAVCRYTPDCFKPWLNLRFHKPRS